MKRSSVLNGCRSVHRRGVVARRYSPVLAVAQATDQDAATASAEHGAMMTALRGLPRRQREVLVLRYYADLNVSAISAALGISPSAVRSTATRGLADGRALLGTWYRNIPGRDGNGTAVLQNFTGGRASCCWTPRRRVPACWARPGCWRPRRLGSSGVRGAIGGRPLPSMVRVDSATCSGA